MSEPLQVKHRKKFRQLEQMFAPRVEIKVYDSEEHVEWLNKRCGKKIEDWGTPAFARLVLAEIFPSLDKIIYLDGDVLVLSSLKNSWYMLPYRDYIIAAKASRYYDTFHFKESEKYKGNKEDWGLGILGWMYEHCPDVQIPFYINSGALVEDLSRMRQEHIPDKLINWMYQYKPPLPDQSTLMIVLRNRILQSEEKWHYPLIKMQHFFDRQKNIKGITVLHFAGDSKVWRIKPHQTIELCPQAITSYIFLRPPTIWHKYRQGSPWRHSLRERFRELFATPEDRKLFKPIFTGLAAALALTTSVSLYYLGRFFFP
jgi:lipopolysaccharide biosynthesis glycosyltransferase